MLLKVGCCGFSTSKEEYFNLFPVVEIQQTFYQPPQLKTLDNWRQQAPEDFEFTIKAWQIITHPATSPTYKRLRYRIQDEKKENYGYFLPTEQVFKAWDMTYACAEVLGAKIVVFQTPASFVPSQKNRRNMKRFFKTIKRKSLTLVWEPRGHWDLDDVERICKENRLTHCVDPFKNKTVFGDIIYFRLHGRGSGYKYKYSDSELNELKKICGKRRGYVLFNNSNMLQDAKEFISIL